MRDVRPQPKSQRGEVGNRHRADPLPVPGVLQAKLAIGKANDPLEREADRVANEVMRTPHNTNIASVPTATDRTGRRRAHIRRYPTRRRSGASTALLVRSEYT